MNNIDVSPWLKNLPVAPEYYPTLAEFQDPISYIFKIEKEASKFGICKIIPPVPSASKKTAIANLNRSLLARAGDPDKGDFCPVFSTRQQQIGFCPRKHHRPVQKPVWESGESYTLGEFEAKAKLFEKGFLKKGLKKCFSVLEIESIYWKATLDKAFSVEYANDMPGSAFIVRKDEGDGFVNGNVSVGETEWNMRGVSRAKGSLLRFMKEEIPGVTSPMVYVAMLFSWFAWHVEDHDLHSLNYLHTGAGKTWYGVPREAAVAFEEVIRVHGYGGEINPLVTFATLAEKTTVMSPEVLVNAGVPCCRLVQNPGEFVVTFPRAYHSGFSHGFNCAEASNIATPGWLMVAKDAAVRRASINCPPMVSHFQLLYDLALSLCSRVPKNICTEPRSSRLKEKKKGEGDILVKDLFVQDVLQNNSLFHTIGKGSSVIILPQVKSGSTLPGDSQLKVKSRLFTSLGSPDLVVKTRKGDIADSTTPRNQDNHMTGAYPVKGKYSALSDENLPISSKADQVVSTLGSQSRSMGAGRDGDPRSDRVSNQGLFSCVTCGILCFSSVAVIQPTETASQYLISGDCSRFTDCVGTDGLVPFNENSAVLESDSLVVKPSHGLFDIPTQTTDQNQPIDVNNSGVCNNGMTNCTSLGLLAMTYGDCSESEDDGSEADIPVRTSETNMSNFISKSSGSCVKVGNGYNRSEGGENKSFDNCLDTKISCPFSPTNCDRGVYMPSDSNAKQVAPTLDEDSFRMHIFCLQHAVQVEKQLRTIGGAHVVLLCHPDYPMLEAQAKQVADELGNGNNWNDISYREANLEDEELIRSALDSEEAVHGNGDWAVKLGINLYYSANLSRSPLYSKQMPYNSMIYSAFGRKSPANTSSHEPWPGRYRKGIVAGKWCGKVWTASQVHPMLTEGQLDEEDYRTNLPTSKKPSLKIERSSAAPKTDDFTPRKSRRKRKPTEKASKVLEAESPKADDSPDEVLENLRVSLKRPKISSRNMKVRKETFEAQINGKETDSQPEDDSPDEVLESWRVSVKRPKISSKHMKVRKETCEPQISDDTDSQPEDGSPDEVLESRRISVKRPKISSRNMKVRRRNFQPLSDKDTDSEPEDDSPEKVLESRRVSVKRPKISSRNMKVKKETFQPQISNEDTDSQPEDDSPDEVLESRRISVKRPKISSRNMKARTETLESQISDKETDSQREDELVGGPSTRLRRRTAKAINESGRKASATGKRRNGSGRKAEATALPNNRSGRMIGTNSTRKKQPKGRSAERAPEIQDLKNSKMRVEGEYQCDIENCTMSFETKQDLALHKRNVCPVKGCGKNFFSHKYLVQHRRVHMEDRPLKCPWKGCKMTFKWAWARTEHIRVHTGERPYVCAESGCGQTFRFVSDFSRHKRKTGHATRKVKR